MISNTDIFSKEKMEMAQFKMRQIITEPENDDSWAFTKPKLEISQSDATLACTTSESEGSIAMGLNNLDNTAIDRLKFLVNKFRSSIDVHTPMNEEPYIASTFESGASFDIMTPSDKRGLPSLRMISNSDTGDDSISTRVGSATPPSKYMTNSEDRCDTTLEGERFTSSSQEMSLPPPRKAGRSYFNDRGSVGLSSSSTIGVPSPQSYKASLNQSQFASFSTIGMNSPSHCRPLSNEIEKTDSKSYSILQRRNILSLSESTMSHISPHINVPADSPIGDGRSINPIESWSPGFANIVEQYKKRNRAPSIESKFTVRSKVFFSDDIEQESFDEEDKCPNKSTDDKSNNSPANSVSSEDSMSLQLRASTESDETENQMVVKEKRRTVLREAVSQEHADEYIISTFRGIADGHVKQKKYSEALQVLDDVLKVQQMKVGSIHQSIGTTLHEMGVVHQHIGDLDKSLHAFQQAVWMKTKTLGKNHTEVANSLVEVGKMLSSKNERNDAMVVLREALRIRRLANGYDHDAVVRVYNMIGTVSYQCGDFDHAMTSFKDALEIQRSNLSKIRLPEPTLLSMAEKLCNMSLIYIKTKQPDMALKKLDEALLIQQSVLGDNHETTLKTMDHIAFTFDQIEDYDEAIKIYDQMLKLQKETYGKVNIKCVPLYEKQSDMKVKQEKYSDALSLLRNILNIHQQHHSSEFDIDNTLEKIKTIQEKLKKDVSSGLNK